MTEPITHNPKIENQPGCVAAAMDILGNKWTGFIIMQLASGAKRFSELEAEVVGISPRTLSQRLDDLEAHAIISKTEYQACPPRHEYALTTKGQDLIPVLQNMASWGEKYPSSR